MTTSDLKINLLKLIVETDDREVLEEIADHFHALMNKKDWWKEISVKEKTLAEIGLRQLEKGEGIPYESVKAKARKLLNK